MIPDQTKLPVSVAVEVVKQGLRIRFGRSVITILGVVLGIAFLMSILTNISLRRGVKEEDQSRAEVNRMYSFLAAEFGSPAGRTLGLVVTGGLNDGERRLLRKLEKEGVERLNWTGNSSRVSELSLESLAPQETALETVGDNASCIIVIGDGSASSFSAATLTAKARQRVVALSRTQLTVEPVEGVTVVQLERKLRDHEFEAMLLEQKKERFRSIWIVAISLVVTVIGITNAMLMSVTERFREIGTMKCLGALSGFIRRIFLIESAFMGAVGGFLGCVLGFAFSLCAYSITYGIGLTFASVVAESGSLTLYLAAVLLSGIVLSVMAAIYPARVAARMVPADALRTNV